MPPRLNKRQLREQEDLLALRSTGAVSDSDGEEMPSSVEKPTGVRRVQVLAATGKLNDTASSTHCRSNILKRRTQLRDLQSPRKFVHSS